MSAIEMWQLTNNIMTVIYHTTATERRATAKVNQNPGGHKQII